MSQPSEQELRQAFAHYVEVTNEALSLLPAIKKTCQPILQQQAQLIDAGLTNYGELLKKETPAPGGQVPIPKSRARVKKP
jgi:hypothetical protein